MKFRVVISFLVAFLMTLYSCTDRSKVVFNKTGWGTKEDWDYPERESMVDDLVKNHKIKGASHKEIVQLLGEPQGTDSSTVFYQVIMDFKGDIDPVYTKNLEITFNNDSIADRVMIKEYNH